MRDIKLEQAILTWDVCGEVRVLSKTDNPDLLERWVYWMPKDGNSQGWLIQCLSDVIAAITRDGVDAGKIHQAMLDVVEYRDAMSPDNRMNLLAEKPAAKERPLKTPVLSKIAEKKDFITTEEAAILLNRQPQTLRKWSCIGNSPISPVNVFGRLMWRVSDIQRLLKGHSE